MSKFKLNIDEPCSQKWENFTPVGKNGFCGQCQKEVVDFTKFTDQEIREYFKDLPNNVCGQLRDDQLRIYSRPKARKGMSRWLAWPIAATATLFSGNILMAQEKDKVEHVDKIEFESSEMDKQRVIYGTVTDEFGEGLPGVNVVVKGTTTGVRTDLDGNYKITVPQDYLWLEFSSVGMATMEQRIGSLDLINISMSNSTCSELGEVVIVRRKFGPRGIWISTRNLFRRIF